ncbi:MAG: hypothetical protein ACWGSQ_09560, partial [Longimicrobiales bacterium]
MDVLGDEDHNESITGHKKARKTMPRKGLGERFLFIKTRLMTGWAKEALRGSRTGVVRTAWKSLRMGEKGVAGHRGGPATRILDLPHSST